MNRSIVEENETCFYDLVNIWEDTNVCEDQYICATALYLISILTLAHGIIINRWVGAPGNFEDVVDVLNATEKLFISMLMENVKIIGSK